MRHCPRTSLSLPWLPLSTYGTEPRMRFVPRRRRSRLDTSHDALSWCSLIRISHQATHCTICAVLLASTVRKQSAKQCSTKSQNGEWGSQSPISQGRKESYWRTNAGSHHLISWVTCCWRFPRFWVQGGQRSVSELKMWSETCSSVVTRWTMPHCRMVTTYHIGSQVQPFPLVSKWIVHGVTTCTQSDPKKLTDLDTTRDWARSIRHHFPMEAKHLLKQRQRFVEYVTTKWIDRGPATHNLQSKAPVKRKSHSGSAI